ncbi:MAG: RNA-binding transcriptional accessory protein [Lachnospiraceae bacterium]|nr:RNA-binding transcriptional accessory protein [Lachnospiraceae bacterium]
MDLIRKLSGELKVQEWRIKAAVDLIDEGNTIPFIARYRKEATGELNDEQLRALDERLRYLRNLSERKEAVLSSIEEQGKLTEELRAALDEAETLVAVEDIYRPFKPKRRTRASIAKERGLEPLSELILKQELEKPAVEAAEDFVSEEKGVNDAKEALSGAMDIIAEAVSDEAEYRTYIRNATMEEGILFSSVKDSSRKSVYEMYYDFEEPIGKLAGHRILAINRGEAEKILTVRINAPEERIFKYLENKIITSDNEYTAPILKEVIRDSYERLIAPAIEREIRNALTEKAEDGAIEVFGKNLKQLLMQPPITGQVVLGWDPAFRTGCKLAVVDETGKVLDTAVIYPTAPQNKVEESKQILKALIKKYGITVISVGNGTASRESERIIVDFLREIKSDVRYVIVNEAGASVYSASRLATEEFPEFDVGQRSAASIARRLQDPLAELVKIDPKSIGVGQYQHDMDQKKLSEALTGVVEDSVNKVGVDLNTASASLLEYISGINKTVAKNIVDYRERNGRFNNRRELLKVDKLGPKAYEQCAGFMRITGGSNPLDETSVHPESYEATEKLLKILGLSMADVKKLREEASAKAVKKTDGKGSGRVSDSAGFLEKRIGNRKELSKELGIGEITLKDIIKELEKPGRDPRDDMPKPLLKSDILEMSDLKPGMVLKGTVRNVIDFGAFVDIGVHQDGLVHISQIADRYIKHPLDAVSVGDVVDVKVLDVDVEKKRIALTMKL